MRIENTDPTSPIRQGDFIHWKGATDPFSRYAVVVTADCDLSRGKHWGRITAVPVLLVDDYCHHLQIPRMLENLKERVFTKLCQLLAKAKPAQDGQEPAGVTSAELMLLDDMYAQQWNDMPDVVRCCRVLRDIRGAQHYPSSKECLKDALQVLGHSPGSIEERVTNGLMNPPGDVLIVPAPSVLGFDFGVAWLRAFREVREQDIASRLTDWAPGRAIRVARLGPVYRYRLTQRLAQVFSDIGLPDDYEGELKAYLTARAKVIAGTAGE